MLKVKPYGETTDGVFKGGIEVETSLPGDIEEFGECMKKTFGPIGDAINNSYSAITECVAEVANNIKKHSNDNMVEAESEDLPAIDVMYF